jgi:hypothetical protein
MMRGVALRVGSAVMGEAAGAGEAGGVALTTGVLTAEAPGTAGIWG